MTDIGCCYYFLFLFLFSFYYFFSSSVLCRRFPRGGSSDGRFFLGIRWISESQTVHLFDSLSLSDLSVISSLCPFLFLSVRFLSLSLISSPLCVNYLLYRTVSFSHSLPVVNFPAVNISDRSAPPPSLLIIHL